jgi:threonine synthase
MNYVSTRGSVSNLKASEAIRMGLAPDGGLLTAEIIPRFDSGQLPNLAQKSYHELATLILSLFLTDYPLVDIQTMVQAAYSYPEKFDDPLVAPVCQLNRHCYLLELWHGPTCAFKDIALQLLPYLMTKSSLLAKDTKEIVILVATSGDTGKAALEGFKNVPGTRIVVFFPNQGVSEIQRLQMVTQEGENTRVVSVQGNFDDAQNGVKQIFADSELAQKLAGRDMAFSSANSINWGRLAPQIVYYFDGYFQLCRKQVIRVGDKINISVPTGNFGNILAAYLAKQMGLPINKLICASNSNNVLTDFINSGGYDRNRKFYTTISPSMDILISSNLERLLYYLSEGNCTLVKGWMNQLKTTGGYKVDSSIAAKITTDFYAGFATEEQTMAEIKRVYQETGMVIDPHTAVGTAVYRQYRRASGDSTLVLVASTASPFKFNTSVLQAIGETGLEEKSEFELLERLEKLAGLKVPKSLAELSHQPVRHKELCRKEEMACVVEHVLGL